LRPWQATRNNNILEKYNKRRGGLKNGSPLFLCLNLNQGDYMADLISMDDFLKIDIRVGKVVRVEDFPNARKPAYKLWVDFGAAGIKKSSAQITRLYQKEDLLGRQVVAVLNFPPSQVADFLSEILILGVVDGIENVVLLQPNRPVENGLRIA
jgi:tRNA-binding protein